MIAQPASAREATRPPLRVGIAIGCLPILIAVAVGFGIVHCRIAPMSYGYCSSADQGNVLTIAVVALGGWVLELLTALVCLVFQRLRRVGVGLLIMVVLFPLLSIAAVYTEAFFLLGH